jgi:hypothetical protein
MPYPVIDTPTYELVLPSNGKKIQYRPFCIKEKKLFLLVKEAKEIKGIVSTIKQIIANCIVSPSNIDVEELPIIDIEMLFVHLRARSGGEVIKLEFECQNAVPGLLSPETHKCGTISTLSFNLLDVKVEKDDQHTNKIQLTENLGVCMRYPTFGMAEVLEQDIKDPTKALDIMADSIEYVFDKETIYYTKDEKREDTIKWFEDMSEDMFEKIKKFFDTTPKIVGKSQFKCSKCGYEEEVRLQGVQDFFG